MNSRKNSIEFIDLMDMLFSGQEHKAMNIIDELLNHDFKQQPKNKKVNKG